MRTLYRPVWDGVQSSLRDIFSEGFPADKVIQRHMKANRKWGSQDRRLYAESVYDIVRWWRKLLFMIDVSWPKEDSWTARDIEVNSHVIEAWCLINDVQIDSAISLRNLNQREMKLVWDDPSLERKVAQSMPDWLDEIGEKELGEKWNEILPILNTSAPVFLRVNRLRSTPEELLRSLDADDVEATRVDVDCIQLAKRSNVFLQESFKAGHFEVQDLASQQVAPELAPEAGQRVIDACAGAGGKTLHIAALMKNKGKIIALDVTDKKLEQLRERANRDGATCIETRLIESSKTIKRLKDSADRLLLDVPCSGIGVLRRNPDAKWRLKPQELKELQQTQEHIINSYSQMCKPGGIMVYSTCSLLPSENENQVAKFLSKNETQWTLESQKTLYPKLNGQDGFFIARLRKN